jgi:hypothetical protein
MKINKSDLKQIIKEETTRFFEVQNLKSRKNKLEEAKKDWNKKQEKYFNRFLENMNDGIAYYANMFDELKDKYEQTKEETMANLEKTKSNLALLALEVEALKIVPAVS